MNKRWGKREGGRERRERRGERGFLHWYNVHVQYVHLLSLSLSLSLSHQILIQSVYGTVVSKLITEDTPLLHSLLQDIFPGVPYGITEMAALRKEISSVCKEYHLIFEEGEQVTSHWVDKVGVA